MQEKETSGLPCNKTSLTGTANIGFSVLRVIGQNEDIAYSDEEPGAYSIANDGQRRCLLGFSADETFLGRPTKESPTVIQTVRINLSKMVMDKDVCVRNKYS